MTITTNNNIDFQNMKKSILLIHNAAYYEYSGFYYPIQEGGFHTTETLRRFDNIADKIIICGKIVHKKSIQDVGNREPLLYKDIQFINFTPNSFYFLKVLVNTIKESDGVIVRLPSFSGILAALVCMFYKRKYIVEVVGNIFEALWYHSSLGKLIALPLSLITKKAIRSSPHVSYNTENYLQSVYPNNKITIGGLSNITIKEGNLDSIIAMRNSRISSSHDNCLVIGMIGGYEVKYKGHDILLKAVAKIATQHRCHKKIRIEFVGNGSNSRIKKLAKKLGILDIIEFKGVLSHNAVFSWLDSIDLYIQPSRTEALSRSVIEAMSRGCHVITSNVGGMKELVEPQFRFAKDNFNELSHLIGDAINNKDIRERTSKRNILFCEKFSPDKIERKRRKFYNIVFGDDNIHG